MNLTPFHLNLTTVHLHLTSVHFNLTSVLLNLTPVHLNLTSVLLNLTSNPLNLTSVHLNLTSVHLNLTSFLLRLTSHQNDPTHPINAILTSFALEPICTQAMAKLKKTEAARKEAMAMAEEATAALVGPQPARCCPPRHPTHLEPSLLRVD